MMRVFLVLTLWLFRGQAELSSQSLSYQSDIEFYGCDKTDWIIRIFLVDGQLIGVGRSFSCLQVQAGLQPLHRNTAVRGRQKPQSHSHGAGNFGTRAVQRHNSRIGAGRNSKAMHSFLPCILRLQACPTTFVNWWQNNNQAAARKGQLIMVTR